MFVFAVTVAVKHLLDSLSVEVDFPFRDKLRKQTPKARFGPHATSHIQRKPALSVFDFGDETHVTDGRVRTVCHGTTKGDFVFSGQVVRIGGGEDFLTQRLYM